MPSIHDRKTRIALDSQIVIDYVTGDWLIEDCETSIRTCLEFMIGASF
jgi:hypothetical protein